MCRDLRTKATLRVAKFSMSVVKVANYNTLSSGGGEGVMEEVASANPPPPR